ncbi:dihydroneopterin aldolase [Legionella waltersii]|uniref:7,8-dihydroneopterin aldolase n=1 Tax=Legionella waltersii TaxID=66969 RepID=A0A0W1AMS5_9GAMM|nr:dihydroneopterin aldolase [Legionella waltersii]KTD82625.1 dihydroneopterin aldolase FolB [Legionella waltersii]SNV07948.1 dihydroneopterin aldolase [Legionella waltersii]
MDSLNITALCVEATIGIYNWEQRIKQKLFLDIRIPIDFKACDDNIEHTLDYDKLCKSVTHFMESKPFQLIETVANEVASLIQNEFQVKQITVAVTKPHAVKNAGGIQVIANR